LYTPALTPSAGRGLGMTGKYIYTRPKTQRQQIEQALRRWLASLRYAAERARRVSPAGYRAI
jgi:hypothetical protein